MTGRAYQTVEELEADVAYFAYLMLRYGDHIAPIFDRLERDLETMRKANTSRDRAKAASQRYAPSSELALVEDT